MSHHQTRLLKLRLRRYFFTGILITMPVGITIYLAWLFIHWVDEMVAPFLPFDIPGVGLIIVITGLTMIGALMAGFLGRWFTSGTEIILSRLPVVKTIYAMIKQILQTALTDQSKAFKEPVLVEFPRKDAWVLAFATSRDHAGIETAFGEKKIGVFVPTTPNLTSGYLIFVPEQDVRPAGITSEEALKLIISGGLVVV